MNLLEDFYHEYTIMNYIVTDEADGGWDTKWTAGATVKMALDDPTQTQRVIAESQRVEVIQNATFPRGTPIKVGMYLRRKDDETLVYRVQTNPVEAPAMSTLDIMKAEVIKTRLPA